MRDAGLALRKLTAVIILAVAAVFATATAASALDEPRVPESVGQYFATGVIPRLVDLFGAKAGADVVFGGDLRGFAFEYMTGGRAVVLGDPGRWICSGMSGGVLFLRHDPARGLDEAGMRDRFAKGAKVTLARPGEGDVAILRELLGGYAGVLAQTGQDDAAGVVMALLGDPVERFRVVRPGGAVMEQTISTE